MNGQIKKYIYIIGTIFIVFFVVKIFISNLHWILLAGLVTYIFMKIVGFVKGKKEQKKQKNPNNFKFNNKGDNVDSYKTSTDDYTNGEVIDVEYEDIEDNKD